MNEVFRRIFCGRPPGAPHVCVSASGARRGSRSDRDDRRGGSYAAARIAGITVESVAGAIRPRSSTASAADASTRPLAMNRPWLEPDFGREVQGLLSLDRQKLVIAPPGQNHHVAHLRRRRQGGSNPQ